MTPRKSTNPPPGQLSPPTQRLIKDLDAARTKENTQAIDRIVARARTEAYHDFLSSSATPIMELVTDLRAAGLNNLVDKAKDGDYDA
jgi:hypothetical protein